MTFAIAFVSQHHFAGLVTDRLLSGGMRIDDSDKCGFVTYADGRFAYTFAGLASANTFYTRVELAKMLAESGRPDAPGGHPKGVRKALNWVADSLSRAVAPLPVRARDKAISVLLVGYRREPLGSVVPESYMVSNHEYFLETAESSPRHHFHVDYQSAAGKVGLSWIGCADLEPSDREPLFRLLTERVRPPAVEKLAVLAIRDVARRDRAQRIGERCSSIVIPEEFRYPITVDYHADEKVSKIHFPANVCAEYGTRGAFYVIDRKLDNVQYSGTDIVVRVPQVGRRKPCPCGSGRRYGQCHGDQRILGAMDSFSVSGRTQVVAMPDDGSDLDMLLM